MGAAETISPKKEPSRPEFFLHIIKSSTSAPDSTNPSEPSSEQAQSMEEYKESAELQEAHQKFKEISESIDNEEKNLQKLEERRRKLEQDMERLQRDIEAEKELFRQKIEADLARKSEFSEFSLDDSTLTASISKMDPLSINTEEVEDRLREYREAVEDSQLQSLLKEDDADIKRLRENLVTYKRALSGTRKEEIVKQKRKAAAKIFQRHLEEVDVKCNEQMSKLSTIQKSIGNINVKGKDETRDGFNF
ncbi:unnamed protein product [Hermetia illucens]|uniref:Uncharacterized protein n=2 Tax=Hermetia illucens TaxID=343691 RepID=A0A7R8YT23_HERIL|nr:unnamed protein product [Hermetia illucens]